MVYRVFFSPGIIDKAAIEIILTISEKKCTPLNKILLTCNFLEALS